MSECTICFETFISWEDVAVLHCGHCFHAACIKKWGKRVKAGCKPDCPICQSKFDMDYPSKGVTWKIFMPGVQLVESKADLLNARRTIGRLKADLRSITDQLKRSEDDAYWGCRDLTVRNEWLEKELDRHLKELANAEKRGKNAKTNAATLRSSLAVSQTEIDRKEQVIQDQMRKLRMAEENRARKEEELADAEKRGKNAKADVATLRRTLADADEYGARLQVKLAIKRKEMDEKDERLRQLETKIAAADTQLRNWLLRVGYYESEMKSQKVKMNEKDKRLRQLETKITELEAKTAELKAATDSHFEEKADFVQRLESKETEQNLLRDKLRLAESRCEDFQTQLLFAGPLPDITPVMKPTSGHSRVLLEHDATEDSSVTAREDTKIETSLEKIMEPVDVGLNGVTRLGSKETEQNLLRDKLQLAESRCEDFQTQLLFAVPLSDMTPVMKPINGHSQVMLEHDAMEDSSVTAREDTKIKTSLEKIREPFDVGLNGVTRAVKDARCTSNLASLDATFVMQTASDLIAELDLKPPNDDLDSDEDDDDDDDNDDNIENDDENNAASDLAHFTAYLDAFRGGVASTISLECLVGILATVSGGTRGRFEYFVGRVMEVIHPTLAAIFENVPVFPVAENDERIRRTSAALKLTTFLLLGRAEDVKSLLRRDRLVDWLSRHLRFDVSTNPDVKSLAFTAFRIIVCRPALRYDWFPSVSLLRALLLGSPAVRRVACKFLRNCADVGLDHSSTLAQLNKLYGNNVVAWLLRAHLAKIFSSALESAA